MLNLTVHSCGVDMEVQLSVICVRVYPETATSGNCYEVSNYIPTFNQWSNRSSCEAFALKMTIIMSKFSRVAGQRFVAFSGSQVVARMNVVS